MTARKRLPVALAVMAFPLLASACSPTADFASVKSMAAPRHTHSYSARDKECLMRAMFFESNRSSRDGLVAVGTVVMNRLRSGKWGDKICDVVGAKRQFAPGVMTRKMNSKALPDVEAAADAVLKGERNKKVKNSMFFHTAGLKFPYKNMHYTVVAGGNAFYEKHDKNGNTIGLTPETGQVIMVAEAKTPPAGISRFEKKPAEPATRLVPAAEPILVAEAAPPPAAPAAIAGEAAPAPEVSMPQPVMVAEAAEASDVLLPMAINGPTPTARPGPVTVAAAFPPQPEAPAAIDTTAAPANVRETKAPAPAVVAEAPPPFAIVEASDAAGEARQARAEAAMSFTVDPSDADAIGAMLAARDENLAARMY